MYRSFVMCDDPKGVVECGTIRKSKISSQKMEHPTVGRKMQKSSNASSSADRGQKEDMIIKGVTDEKYVNPSSFQLLEVFKGAEKLNHVIDSWSRGMSDNGRSKDIAKDLLRGAIDLQESLIMLGKLQEASQYMAQLKKKEKQKQERRRTDEVESLRRYSCGMADQIYQTGFQQQRLSADGSSRDCIEELRKAIRDGFARQNLLPKADIHEKISFDRRKKHSASHVPSTSSSQSSAVQSSNTHCNNASIPEIAPQKKEKGSNLIARLMGLEDMPSKQLQSAPKNRLDMGTNLNSQRRPFFDIDMPKVRKPQPLMQKVDLEQRTSKEILETMQFKGLLKSRSVKELKFRANYYSTSYSKEMLSDDIQPIVLIKPYDPRLQSEEVPATFSWKEEALNTKLMPRKMKVEEGVAPIWMDSKGETINAREMHWKADEKEPPIKRLSTDEGAKDSRKVAVKQMEEEIKIVVQEEGPTKGNKLSRKMKGEDAPTKRCSQEDRTQDDKDVVVIRERNSKTKLKGSSKNKTTNPLSPQQQKKELSDRKVDKVLKAVSDSRKLVSREIVKPKNVSRSQDQAKETSVRLRKSGDMSIFTKGPTPRQRSITPKTTVKQTTKTIIHNSENRKKEKPVYESLEAKLITKNSECKDDAKVSPSFNDHSLLKETADTLAGLLSAEEDANAPQSKCEENCNDKNCSFCNVTLLASGYAKDTATIEEVNDQISHIADATVGTEEVDDHIDHITDAAISTEKIHDSISHITDTSISTEQVDDCMAHITDAPVPSEEVDYHIDHVSDVASTEEVDPHIGTISDATVSTEEDDDHISQITMDSAGCKTGTNLKMLLLSNPSFVTLAEELFHPSVTIPNSLPPSGVDETEVTEMKVCFDYANEYIARRSLVDSQTRHPLLPSYMLNWRISLSIEQLVEEVCDGVETLKRYREHDGCNLPSDSLYATLERDMRMKGVVCGTWDLAWRNGFSVDGAEQVVREMEKLLVSDLIEDLFT